MSFTRSIILFVLSFAFIFVLTTSYVLAETEDRTMTSRKEALVRMEELKVEKEEMRKKELEERQEIVRSRKTESESKREEFRSKLSEINDRRKAKSVENLSNRFIALNQTWVANWQRTLTRMSQLLVKVEMRVSTAQNLGYDTTEVEDAISKARVAINAAEVTLLDQSEKEYVINITSEDALRPDVKETMDLLKSDWLAIKEEMVTVHQKVRNVIVMLGELVNEGENETE